MCLLNFFSENEQFQSVLRGRSLTFSMHKFSPFKKFVRAYVFQVFRFSKEDGLPPKISNRYDILFSENSEVRSPVLEFYYLNLLNRCRHKISFSILMKIIHRTQNESFVFALSLIQRVFKPQNNLFARPREY